MIDDNGQQQQEQDEREQATNDISSHLSRIQKELHAPKGQMNKFGGYSYRSCEDILAAIKPILNGCYINITDEIVMLGDRFYIKATASLAINGQGLHASGFAREALAKKGMDESQITGSASSYARKYALNGLFAIDDTKDADTMDNRPQPINKDQADTIYNMLKESNSDTVKFCGYMNIKSVVDMPSELFNRAVSMLDKKIEKESLNQHLESGGEE